jgi:hypothetical protein
MLVSSSDQQNEAQDIGLLSKESRDSHNEPDNNEIAVSDSDTIFCALENISDPQVVRKQSLVYLGFFVIMGLMVGSVGPLMPSIYSDLTAGIDRDSNVSSSAAGLQDGRLVPVFIARGFGGLTGSLLGGALIDRAPRGDAHWILGAGIFLTAVGTGAMLVSSEVHNPSPSLSTSLALLDSCLPHLR